ncbi:ABC transporter ATP-binding protein [Haladaptatus salinisoli]|uniref:ABC transporter ATP-binding protein n=1 Tax=Haladaptatus salinisoli TaxID=2884876 RepID=UPI001D0AF526|nr:ABC transporter ATP-binding protein [Haladaptatus salinisoli]
MSAIELEDVTKRYGSFNAVDDLSLQVKEGELLCVLGPSGCGKSTTMRMIGGLERPTEGGVHIAGQEVTQQPPYERDCSIVFQDWALFPHKTILENVAFGLKMDGIDKTERKERARETLEMVQLDGFEDQKPKELSGGQQQRVALARSLIIEPHVLLLDEPLSNLDKRLKEEMQIELKEIHKELDQTMVHVTHDQSEAFTLADRIGIMNNGELVQVGAPPDVYNNPENQFVEEFLGDTNFLEGKVVETTSDGVVAETDLGCHVDIPVKNRKAAPSRGESVSISLRPENMRIRQSKIHNIKADGGDSRCAVGGQVDNVIYRGSMTRLYINTGSRKIFIEQQYDPDNEIEEQQDVVIQWDPERLVAFDGEETQFTAFEK